MGDQYDLTDDYLPNGTTKFETDNDSCKMEIFGKMKNVKIRTK